MSGGYGAERRILEQNMATATTTTRAASTFAVFDAACDPAGHVQAWQRWPTDVVATSSEEALDLAAKTAMETTHIVVRELVDGEFEGETSRRVAHVAYDDDGYPTYTAAE